MDRFISRSAALVALAGLLVATSGCNSGRRGRGIFTDTGVARDTGISPGDAATDTGGADGSPIDTGTGLDTGVPGECTIENVIAGTGAPIWSGVTSGESAIDGTCNSGSGPEAILAWMPLESGAYTIDTNGSAIDTVLYVQEGEGVDACDGVELACDDDGGDGTQSQVYLEFVEAGGPYLIFVDSYSSPGPVVLNINFAATP